ncbi:MAG: Rrf2 family transcriptional regulator [Aphanocapsa lilacina HA4352-LM1]|nr:Rrf2 family transcriptional regulator [Aphanocapsa lilacina HA4352-LM1]
MELSAKSEYALLAMLQLALGHGKGEPMQIKEIAQCQSIPDRYLEQLLADLRRHGLVKSQRGARGGYLLAREPFAIHLLEIVQCIEGQDENETAPNTLEASIVREAWDESRRAAEQVLKGHTLQKLCELHDRRQSTVMYYI